MLSRNPLLLVAALACAPFSLLAETAPAAAPSAPAAKIAVGKKAPEFKPTAWIQGEPVTAYEKGKVYLIECWATWCGPCLAQIPHLTKLDKEYSAKGLVVIGTNVWDKDADNAAGFVKKQGDKMPYRVAFDNRTDGLVTKDWLVAAGVNGIPHAFVVRDGILIWRGHPGTLTDATVESMLAGTFDGAKAEKERLEQEASRAKLGAASKKIAGLITAKDFDGALKAADEFEALLPESGKGSAELARVRILTAKGDKAGAVAKLEKLAASRPADLSVQFNVAMNIMQGGLKDEKGAPQLAIASLNRAIALEPKAGDDPSVKKLLEAATKAAEAQKDAPVAAAK